MWILLKEKALYQISFGLDWIKYDLMYDRKICMSSATSYSLENVTIHSRDKTTNQILEWWSIQYSQEKNARNKLAHSK